MFVVILSYPQLGENIGACARAMKNFGIHDLRIVSPRDGWPNPKAESASVGAIDIIHNAKIYESIDLAIQDLEFIYATTGTQRALNKSYTASKNLKSDFPYGKKVGIMLGRENSGLNNQEISHANKILTINTNPEFTSLNIAQALIVICYELFDAEIPLSTPDLKLATKDDLFHFHNHLFHELEVKEFFKSEEKKELMKQNIVNLFSRIENLSRTETQILRGIINALSSDK